MKKSTIAAVIIAAILGLFLAATMPATCQTWHPNKSVIKAPKDTAKTEKKEFQCWGTTQKGERCKRHVSINGAYCYQHSSQKQ